MKHTPWITQLTVFFSVTWASSFAARTACVVERSIPTDLSHHTQSKVKGWSPWWIQTRFCWCWCVHKWRCCVSHHPITNGNSIAFTIHGCCQRTRCDAKTIQICSWNQNNSRHSQADVIMGINTLFHFRIKSQQKFTHSPDYLLPHIQSAIHHSKHLANVCIPLR